jgi:2-dehydro-3-deoxygluconokinase
MSTPALDVVTLGEAMAMLVADQPGPLETVPAFHKRTAGAETNVAIGLARLGFRVGWLSRLGDDSWGRYLKAEMQREGIDCSHVAIDGEARTGLVLKERAVDGRDPAIEYHRRGSAASRMTRSELDLAFLASARHLHATGVFAAVSASCLDAQRAAIDAMKAAGRTISFDTNLRPTLWRSKEVMTRTLNELAGCCDWVLPGLEEGRILTGLSTPEEIAGFYLDRGAQWVMVKLGAEGAYYRGRGRSGYVPAVPVAEIVDTVGAGDGFAVGVISALLEGRDIDAAVRRGAWIGARALQVLGDTEGLPTRRELEESGL